MTKLPVLALFLLNTIYAQQSQKIVTSAAKKITTKSAPLMPPTFNKTHFIVGDTRPRTPAQSSPAPSNQAPHIPAQVLFSPDDDIRQHLVTLIEHEKYAIRIAAFAFTDPAIAQALCAARQRGVTVELITDPGGLQDRQSKVGMLCEHGIDVRVYNPNYEPKSAPSLMHNKFALFDNNNNHKIALTGSLNWTKSACDRNQENITIMREESVFNRFAQQFEVLKKRSKQYR